MPRKAIPPMTNADKKTLFNSMQHTLEQFKSVHPNVMLVDELYADDLSLSRAQQNLTSNYD